MVQILVSSVALALPCAVLQSQPTSHGSSMMIPLRPATFQSVSAIKCPSGRVHSKVGCETV
jgi:hypothetical protein